MKKFRKAILFAFVFSTVSSIGLTQVEAAYYAGLKTIDNGINYGINGALLYSKKGTAKMTKGSDGNASIWKSTHAKPWSRSRNVYTSPDQEKSVITPYACPEILCKGGSVKFTGYANTISNGTRSSAVKRVSR